MKKLMTMCATVLMAGSMAFADNVAGWDAFVIRKSNAGTSAPNTAPVITDYTGGKIFQVNLDGQKAGWGTDNMNGKKIGDIQSISITRNTTVGWGPYLNFWVTDGNGGYAVIANEPSNPGEWSPGSAYDTTWNVLKDAQAKVYETGSGFITPSGTTFTFNDFANYTIATPTSHWGGPGAPDDLDHTSPYTAYGINWVFGDTKNNYTANYDVSAPTVVAKAAPVPLPAAAWAGMALMAGLVARRSMRKTA